MKITLVSIMLPACVMLIAIRPAQGSAQIITTDASVKVPREDSVATNAPTALMQGRHPEPPVLLRERDLSGPRIGFTLAAGNGELQRELERRGMGRVVSQFGWHFEHQVVPLGGGPQLVTQLIPLLGGVEYGKVIPSITFVVGMRLQSGAEFGMGPSFTLVNAAGRSNVGLVIAAGQSVDYAGVSIPLDLAVSTNPQGTRTTLTAGYAIRRASR